MGEPGWRLTVAARRDLEEIWRHGAAQWGMDHADRHADTLFALFTLIAENPGLARERREFTPPVRLHPHGAHLVIYRETRTGVQIIRILHARQDWTAILGE